MEAVLLNQIESKTYIGGEETAATDHDRVLGIEPFIGAGQREQRRPQALFAADGSLQGLEFELPPIPPLLWNGFSGPALLSWAPTHAKPILALPRF
ncbi:hypothetical protein IWX75_003478 [Arthrobacter sp. CAN_A6]